MLKNEFDKRQIMKISKITNITFKNPSNCLFIF